MQYSVESPGQVAGVIAAAQHGDRIQVEGGSRAEPIIFPPWRTQGLAPLVDVRAGHVVLENGGRVKMTGGALRATNAAVEIFGGTADLRGCSGEVGSRSEIVARHCQLRATGFAKVEVQDSRALSETPSHIEAIDRAQVIARIRARVAVAGEATVEAFDDALVEEVGIGFLGLVTLRDRSRLQWKQGALSERFTVRAYDDAVASFASADGLTLELADRARAFVGSGHAELTLRGEAQATVSRMCHVRAYDRTRVIATGKGSKVELYDAATCDAADWDVQVRDLRPRPAVTP